MSAELYDTGLAFVRPSWQPQIVTATSPLVLGSNLMLTGSRFQGISQASGGNFQDSSANYPVVQLRDIDSSQLAFLPVNSTAGWSDTAFTSTPVNFPPGPALVTVFTNGIPSDAAYLVVVPPPTPTPTPRAHATNLSTRLLVGTGADVGIGGFIVSGSGPRHLLLRGMGPLLSQFGILNFLADPVLELHGPRGFSTVSNDNWRDTQEAEIIATGRAPSNDLESAMVADLAPGAYTAILAGNADTTGVGLVEIYDLSTNQESRLANISTRGDVGTGDNIVIAGFILGGASGEDTIIVRGLGPSLSGTGVSALADPKLELRDSQGALIVSDDNWMDDPNQAAIIQAAGLAPTNSLESAIAATLMPGPYTALLSGVNNGTGVGLVEVYDLGASAH
jgi:hypothetical protein